jgi:deoxyribonuclease V
MAGDKRDQAAPAVAIDRRYLPDQALSPSEVSRLQAAWAQLVVEEPLPHPPRLVAGCDVHMRGDRALATVVVVRFPELDVVETVHGEAELGFPYVPGLLSWRELPALLDALARLTARPDLVFADGQGLAHPRRFGLACHLGLAIDLPTLGCAKSLLRGRHEPLEPHRGARAPPLDRGQLVGMAVRTRDNVTPLYVSVGHRVTLDTGSRWTRRPTTSCAAAPATACPSRAGWRTSPPRRGRRAMSNE